MASSAETGDGQGDAPTNGKTSGCVMLFVVALSLFGLGRCVSGVDVSPTSSATLSDNNTQQTLLTTQPEVQTSPESDASSGFITATRLNGRESPSTSSAVKHVFNRGDAVQIVERKQDWAKVVQNGVTIWVLGKHISSLASNEPAAPTKTLTRQSSSKPTQTSQRSKRTTSYGGSCPCGSGRVCTGPRGGRYCITTGGNKRYGV